MSQKHEIPTPGQMAEFWKKAALGKVTKKRFQEFLDSLDSPNTLTKALLELEQVLELNSGTNYYIGYTIRSWFLKLQTNIEFTKAKTRVHRFANASLHKFIITDREKEGDYFECDIVEAITIATELIRDNEVQELGKSIAIYLTNTHNNNKCWLRIFCTSDAIISVDVSEVHLDGVWSDIYGVICKAL